MKKMNLPNKLTVLRLCLVPVILLAGMLPDRWVPTLITYVICAVLFIVASITDMLDGKIARRDNLITDFGKFMDPIADKFMVIGALFVILYMFDNLRLIMIITLLVVVFRELAVTSMRLVVSTGQNIVIAANKLGKLKTVLQIVAISTTFIEPVLQHIAKTAVNKLAENPWEFEVGKIIPLTWITIVLSLILTVWSGLAYIKGYGKYLDPEK